jgi:demethylmenaquinone methyltransferase/2-methoxy-6-polyprenyl-1,4-benzoquinol methylase
MGVSGMDKFMENDFDLVMSTLVFSELSADEQTYALRHAYRILKPGGRLAIADEVNPEQFTKRLLYHAIRIPLLLVTFALTQTTTKAVEHLPDLIADAGFSVQIEERSSLGSFLYLVAIKEKKE